MAKSPLPRKVSRLSRRQKSIRQEVTQLPLPDAIRMAGDGLFGFTHRATDAKALWSETVQVWLGRNTFLDWALEDADFNIPRLVWKSDGAPEERSDLRQAVRTELMAYFVDRLNSLPKKSMDSWLPLP